jgi:hypothetical protein
LRAAIGTPRTALVIFDHPYNAEYALIVDSHFGGIK